MFGRQDALISGPTVESAKEQAFEYVRERAPCRIRVMGEGFEEWSLDVTEGEWDEKQERQEERQALERLAAEFRVVDSVLEEWQSNHLGVAEASEILLHHTGPPGSASPLSADSIGALLWTLRWLWTVDPPAATLSSLESSGRLGVIRNDGILTQLASWQAQLSDLQSDEAEVARWGRDTALPYLVSRAGWRTISSNSDAMHAGDPSAFPDGLVELLGQREFESQLDVRRTYQVDLVATYDQVRASLDRVRSLIQEELAR